VEIIVVKIMKLNLNKQSVFVSFILGKNVCFYAAN
jgi:hypothetical protein